MSEPTHRNKLGLVKLVAVGFGALGFSPAVFAYLDPGTGSIILQALIAAVVGAAVTLKLYWLRVKGFFSSFMSSGKSNTDSTDES